MSYKNVQYENGKYRTSNGGGGTSDYADLNNKPQINSNILSGNQTGADLGLVDSVSGKGLSTEDYTTSEKIKLSGIESGAKVNVQSDWNQTNINADDYIKNKPSIPVERKQKIVFLSDSYGDSSNADSHGKTFVDYIREYLGIGVNLIDIHANGGGFIGDTSVQWTTSWKDLIEENLSSIGDPDLITDVIFAGGANDIGKGFANINNAINTAVTYCKTTFPNCKVSIASDSLIFDATNLITRASEQLQSYRRCAKYGARYLCNTEFIMMISTYLKSDHVHPNDNGVDALGYYMTQAIKNGVCTVDYNLLSPASTTHNNGNLYMRTKMINQSLSIFGNGGFILFDKVGSGSLSNDGELATITDSCFLGRAFMMPCVIRINGTTIHHGVVYLDDWYNGKIRMKLFDYNVSSTISYSSHLEVFVNATFTNDGNATNI